MKSKEFNKKIKEMTIDELKANLSDLNKSLVESKFKVSLAELKNNAMIFINRKNIARIKTEINKRLNITK